MRTLVALVALSFAPSAWACSCIAPDIKQAWHESSDTVGLKILAERVVGYERQFKARVIKPFSGCTQPGDIVVLTTALDSAACGSTYTVGSFYVLAGNDNGTVAGHPALSVNSCGWVSEYSALSTDDLDFLMSRPVECAGVSTCADGAPPVNCLVDPCSLAICPDGTCESNYCGGSCTAEFYDADGDGVCEPW